MTLPLNNCPPLEMVTLLNVPAEPMVRLELPQTAPAPLTIVVAAPAMKAFPLVRTLPLQSASVPWFVRIPATYVALVTNAE